MKLWRVGEICGGLYRFCVGLRWKERDSWWIKRESWFLERDLWWFEGKREKSIKKIYFRLAPKIRKISGCLQKSSRPMRDNDEDNLKN